MGTVSRGAESKADIRIGYGEAARGTARRGVAGVERREDD